MNIFDIITFILLIFFIINGFRKGLILSLTSLVSWTLAIIAAIYFSDFTFEILTKYLSFGDGYLKILAIFINFIVVFIVLNLLGKLITSAIKAIGLGFLNRITGMVLGLIKGAFIISCILFVLNKYDVNKRLIKGEVIEESRFYKPLLGIAPAVFPFIKNYLEDINTLKPKEQSLENETEEEFI